jgi:hypothetical protein
MRNKILFSAVLFLWLYGLKAQTPDKHSIRVVDTLTSQEKINRNPVLLQSELDSMIRAYEITHPATVPQQVTKESITTMPLWSAIAAAAVVLIILILLFRMLQHQRDFSAEIGSLKKQLEELEFYAATEADTSTNKKAESNGWHDKQKKNESAVLQEYESIKRSITEVYKIKNYPGFDKMKAEGQIIKDLLITERAVANTAFEKFLKPIIAISDANKNNPAKMSEEDSRRMLDLLVSLSLYYSEYLYLRINDLSVGGNMVQRIGSNGKGIDPALLKKLNTEHGSRALAMRMALNKAGIDKLTYPVFDDTDLNNY